MSFCEHCETWKSCPEHPPEPVVRAAAWIRAHGGVPREGWADIRGYWRWRQNPSDPPRCPLGFIEGAPDPVPFDDWSNHPAYAGLAEEEYLAFIEWWDELPSEPWAIRCALDTLFPRS